MAAVAPLAVGEEEGAWRTGLRWGLGHSSGVLLVGALSLALRNVLPMERLSSWAERMVGAVLIGIGIWGLRRALTARLHLHEHVHNGRRHVHVHVHGAGTAHPAEGVGGSHEAHSHAAFAVGTLHGLAGSAHFLGVLPSLAFPTLGGAVGYLAAFGVGTVLAMMLFSSAVGWVAQGVGSGGQRGYQRVMVACSLAAVGVGVGWLIG